MSEVINLNSTNPGAPVGSQNIAFAKAASTGTDPTTGLAIFPVSASVPIASDSQLGIVQPDGDTISIDDAGVISAIGGGTLPNFYGNAMAIASAGNSEVILGSAPIAGSLSIFVAGSIVPPNAWNLSGSTATLATALTSGQVVVAIWATTNTVPGGITVATPGLPVPVEQWLMNEGAGQIFHTSSSSGNNINTQNITWDEVTGFPGTVPVFNGSNSSGIGTNQTNTNFDGTTPFSLSVWALITEFASPNEGGGTFMTTLQGGQLVGWEFGVNGDQNESQLFNFDMVNNLNGNAIEVVANVQPSTGVIHHFCTTYDGSRDASGVTLYVDGVQQSVTVGQNGLTGSIANTEPVNLAERTTNGTATFQGNMADLRIYDVELSSSQVSTLFAAGPA